MLLVTQLSISLHFISLIMKCYNLITQILEIDHLSHPSTNLLIDVNVGSQATVFQIYLGKLYS